MNPQDWQLQLALGTCRAGRLLSAASLACSLFALAMLGGSRSGLSGAGVLWSLAVLAVLPGLYLGVRLEIDRSLFQRLAEAGGSLSDDLAALDGALEELGLAAGSGMTRNLAARVGGGFRLARWLGGMVGGQVLLLFLAAWSG